MAERPGFEPGVPLQARRLSKPVHSTTLPPLRGALGRRRPLYHLHGRFKPGGHGPRRGGCCRGRYHPGMVPTPESSDSGAAPSGGRRRRRRRKPRGDVRADARPEGPSDDRAEGGGREPEPSEEPRRAATRDGGPAPRTDRGRGDAGGRRSRGRRGRAPRDGGARADEPSRRESEPRRPEPPLATASGFVPFDLEPNVLKGLAHAGYEDPTPIQAQMIPIALEGHNVVARSRTGTGQDLRVPRAGLLARSRRCRRERRSSDAGPRASSSSCRSASWRSRSRARARG